MGSEQYLIQVKKNLEDYDFDVKLNGSYHGIDISIEADSKSSNKKVFMYVLDHDRALPAHIWNLNNIKNGNDRILKNSNCDYIVFAPKGSVKNAEKISEKYNIPIFTNMENFQKDISRYSSEKNLARVHHDSI